METGDQSKLLEEFERWELEMIADGFVCIDLELVEGISFDELVGHLGQHFKKFSIKQNPNGRPTAYVKDPIIIPNK